MKRYSLLIFDWDGTLVDSEGLAIESIRQAAQALNHPIPDETKIHQHFGLSLNELLQQLFPNQEIAPLIEKFYHFFSEEHLASNFFPGAIATLKSLKQRGYTLAIATNRAKAKLHRALAINQLNSLFSATRSADEGAAKPNPEMLNFLLDHLGYAASEALMIGDTVFDLQLAQNAQVDAIAACYGNTNRQQLASFNPVGIIENIEELTTLL